MTSLSINKELNFLRRKDSCSGHTQPASDSSEDTTPTTAADGCSSSSGVWGGEGGQCYEDSLSIVSSICDNNSNIMQNNRQHQHHHDNNHGFALPPSPMDNILPPLRPLTDEEQSHIFLLLHGIINLKNAECPIQAEQDASDMINYTCELIDDKMTVCDIIEEIDFMDLDICSPTVLIEMRKCLAVYLSQLEDDVDGTDSLVSGGNSNNYGFSLPTAVPQDEDEARAFAMAAAAAERRSSLVNDMKRSSLCSFHDDDNDDDDEGEEQFNEEEEQRHEELMKIMEQSNNSPCSPGQEEPTTTTSMKDARRMEVKKIIKNRRLSCEDKKDMINIVKQKYAPATSLSTSTTPPTPQVVARQAMNYAQRRRSSIEELGKVIQSSSISQPPVTTSLRERIAMLSGPK